MALECHLTPNGWPFRGIANIEASIGEFLLGGHEKNVIKMVAECEVCQKYNYQVTRPSELLQPLPPIPEAIWEEFMMDFIV